MPAYLAHAHVLIEMATWLETLRGKIDERRVRLGVVKRSLSALDERAYYLAGRALDHLKDPAPAAADVAMPVTHIKNGVGDGLSKFAFVGSLGPDFAAAGYILALNQRWAATTLHNGAPRRAWVDAKSTTFVLKLLELLEKDESAGRLTSAQRRNMVSYALGHLSHIAADVLLHPAVYQLIWGVTAGALDPLEQQLFEVAIDARLATAAFQRSDLNDDIQSWTDYYLDTGDFKEPLGLLMDKLSGAFKDTYGDVHPNQPVCGLANPADCVSPTVDRDFLMDGYRNTVNWALDAGYDHGSLGFDIYCALSIIAGAVMPAVSLAGATEKFSTFSNMIFGINQDVVDRVSAANRAEWQDKGAGNHTVWHDIIDKSLSWPGNIAKPFSWLMGGGLAMTIMTFGQAGDGIFGQGTVSMRKQPVARGFGQVALPVEAIAEFLIEDFWPGLEEQGWWPAGQWVLLIIDTSLDFLEHFTLTNDDRGANLEGDHIADALWMPLKVLSGIYFASNALTMLWKSSRTATGGGRDSGVQPLDFVFPLVFGILASAIFVPLFRNYFFAKIAQSRWPSTDAIRVNSLLPEVQKDGKWQLSDTPFVTKFHVRLFGDGPDVIKVDGGRNYFPESDVPPAEADRQAREDVKARIAHLEEWPDAEYTLKELLDHSARFAGLLAMSAVAYNEATAPVRAHMAGVFKDWNLDYVSIAQWKDLLLASADESMGVLHAAKTWSDDLIAGAVESAAPVPSRLQSALGITEVAGGIRADFLRDGKSIATDDARSLRLQRPGAILLPNLDIDEPAPSPLPAILPSRAALLDAIADDKVSTSGNDAAELARIKVRKPGTAGSPHTLVLALHADDASRVRIFEVTTGAPDTWPVRLGATSAGAVLEYELPAAGPDEMEFAIEAKSFGMDPGLRAPTGPGPLAPAPFPPSGIHPGDPTVAERRPHEVWLELKHKESGAIVPGIRDVALFTIAPFILQPNIHKTERIYAVSFRDVFNSAGTLLSTGNHGFIADLVDALSSDPGLAAKLSPVKRAPAATGVLDEFVPHKPVAPGDPDRANLLYLADGRRYRDQWIQDEFEIGYTQAPHEWMHVVLHTPRSGNIDSLGQFVVNEMAEDRVGLFNGVSVAADSINFGGNLEVSPAVPAATVLQPFGNGGPEIPPQPAAPMGKIILGEGRPYLFDIDARFAADLQAAAISIDLGLEFEAHDYTMSTSDSVEVITPDREWMVTTRAQVFWLRRTVGAIAVHGARLAEKHYREFLDAQRAQPVVRIDTSWLNVGHVDEVISFVPTTTGMKGYCLLVASSELGIRIHEEAVSVNSLDPTAHPLTKMFRRRRWSSTLPRAALGSAAAAIAVPDMLSRTKAFNDALQVSRLTPIEDRLRQSLGLDPADVKRLPVIFDPVPAAFMAQLGTAVNAAATPDGIAEIRTAAFTPGVVNLLVVDDHMMVPKPFGARMKVADTITVLSNVGISGILPADLAPLVGHETWALRGTTTATLAAAYGVSAAAIKGHANNAGKFTAAGAVIKNWERIFIPEDNVDLIEAYVLVTLAALNLKVHFIDDWDLYHRLEGEVHCGTNAMRTAPETDSAFVGQRWWDAPSITT